MQPYDVALKELFQSSAKRLLEPLLGAAPAEWLNVELPATQNPRVDLLARLDDGRLLHFELQTNNDADFPRRMAEYYFALYRRFDQHVEQAALYIGRAAMTMAAAWTTPAIIYKYRLLDIRDLDGGPLLASDDIGDNILAVLTSADKHRVFERVLTRLATLDSTRQSTAKQQFVILCGLRGLAGEAQEETAHMPIVINLEENEILAPAYRRGKNEGLLEGELIGEQRGERKILLRLAAQRFGALPQSVTDRILQASEPEIAALSERILVASSLDEFLGS